MASPALFDLTGRVAVITGGNGGIGLAIALGLAEAGAAVAILTRNEEKSRSALEEVETRGARGLAIKVDVSNRTEIPPALARVEQALGPIHVLVNNAGIAIAKGILEQSLDEWDQVIETNLNACFILSKLAA